MPRAIPCGHCKQPRCRLCFLARTDARYRALWGIEAPPPPPVAVRTRDPNKPRVSLAQLAEQKRH
jgi:hypothetical protein